MIFWERWKRLNGRAPLWSIAQSLALDRKRPPLLCRSIAHPLSRNVQRAFQNRWSGFLWKIIGDGLGAAAAF